MSKTATTMTEQIKPKKGYIYLIAEEDNSFFKIGFSTKPENRLRALQTSNPRNLRIIKTIKGDKRDEAKIQYKFRASKENNEWFRNTKEIRDFFKTNEIPKKVYKKKDLFALASDIFQWLKLNNKTHCFADNFCKLNHIKFDFELFTKACIYSDHLLHISPIDYEQYSFLFDSNSHKFRGERYLIKIL
ncbi:MAG: hypothetical protein Unbinned5081contig1003_38 [Prokaryotic dsDNA virus sp.]|nr:MAG: hypothetical protein Unbinned5081contig1003_38 [Prokaryotic dsDNA virus sp.]|tara:strand:- start:29900 stop:30463 length:564 start_codon:yes stop_codon:yes gene_type:complete